MRREGLPVRGYRELTFKGGVRRNEKVAKQEREGM